MRAWKLSLVVAMGALAGCDLIGVAPSDKDTGGGLFSDADTDADSDADSDADRDTDTDTDTDVEWICDADPSTAAPGGPDCYTARLSCGDVVVGTNEGGTDDYEGEDWETWFCTPNLDRWDYSSPERVYQFDLPAQTNATVKFDTPCADLDLFVLNWRDEDTCPTSDAGIVECEAVDDTGIGGEGETVRVWDDEGSQYLVIVDGRGGETGNYRISVTCED